METRLEDKVQTFLEGLVRHVLRVVQRGAVSDLIRTGLLNVTRLGLVRREHLRQMPDVASWALRQAAGLLDHWDQGVAGPPLESVLVLGLTHSDPSPLLWPSRFVQHSI